MRNVKVVVAALCLFSVACRAALAQAPEARRGEIVLEGWVLSADEASQSFIMAVRAYTLPPRETVNLPVPRARVIQVAQDMPIHVRWNTDEITGKLAFKDIQPGVRVVVAGPHITPKPAPAAPAVAPAPGAPATPAQPVAVIVPLPALNVALWTGTEGGKFVYESQPAGAVPLIPQPSKPTMTKPAPAKSKKARGKTQRGRRRR